MPNITIPMPSIDGNKTYISIALLLGYYIATGHGWLQPQSDVEMALKAAIFASAAHKGNKILDALNAPDTGKT